MKTMLYSLLIAIFSTAPLMAETPMTGAEFEKYVTGKTIDYADQGQSFGSEQYLSNRDVLWAGENRSCIKGVWYEKNDLICFIYENDPAPRCWTFHLRNDRLAAVYQNDPENRPLLETGQSTKPLHCLGPEIGV